MFANFPFDSHSLPNVSKPHKLPESHLFMSLHLTDMHMHIYQRTISTYTRVLAHKWADHTPRMQQSLTHRLSLWLSCSCPHSHIWLMQTEHLFMHLCIQAVRLVGFDCRQGSWAMLQCRCKTFVSQGYLQCSQAECRELGVCLFQREIGDWSCLLGMLLVMRSQEMLPSSSVFLSSILSSQLSAYSSSAFHFPCLPCCCLFLRYTFYLLLPFLYHLWTFNSFPSTILFTTLLTWLVPFFWLFISKHLLCFWSSLVSLYVFVCVSLCMYKCVPVCLQCCSPLWPFFWGRQSSFRQSTKWLWNANAAN